MLDDPIEAVIETQDPIQAVPVDVGDRRITDAWAATEWPEFPNYDEIETEITAR